MEKISIIITAYNDEKYIKKCIESVIYKTYKNIEIIIINDESNDNTLEIINQFNDERIKIYNQKNLGTGKARNNGLKYSTGDFIIFIDGDDYIDKNILMHSYNLIKKYDADIVANSFVKKKKISEISILNTNDAIKNLIAIPEKMTIGVPGKLWKKELSLGMKFDENNMFEDIEFSTELICKANKVVFLNSGYYHYVKHANSRSSSCKNDDRLNACINGIKIVEKYCIEERNDYIVYSMLNAIGIINRIILNGKSNTKIENEIRKFVSDNIKKVRKSCYPWYKKLQIYFYNSNYKLYNKIYKFLK